jgi:hypothetical protein
MTEYTPQLTEHAQRKPNYLLIFGVLAAITLIEVTLATDKPLVLVLLSMAKIVLVASYYMHLRFASGWFTAIFLTPLPFVALVMVALVVALAPGADGSASVNGVCSLF